MSQHVYEYPRNYVIGPYMMFHVSRSYSKVSSSKSMPLRSPVWEYFEIVCEKKVHCKLCVPPAITTLCVCAHVRVCACVHVHLRAYVLACVCACVRVCLCACMDACISVCVCATIIRYLIVKETTIRIAKINYSFQH